MPAELIFVRKLSILSPLLGMPPVFIVWLVSRYIFWNQESSNEGLHCGLLIFGNWIFVIAG